MAGPYVAFSDLKTGRDVQRIVGRLMRFWDARNVKKGGELMGVDFLLIDEKATVMQGTIHVQHLPKFDELLKEGSLYVVTAFEVRRSNPRFKLTYFHLSIRFSAATTLVELDESFCEITKQLFRFCTHQELVVLANTNNELPDVLRKVSATKAYRNEASGRLERMLVPLHLQSGEKVRLSAFDVHATTLNRQMEKKSIETCVMLATNINPKFFVNFTLTPYLVPNSTSTHTLRQLRSSLQACRKTAPPPLRNTVVLKKLSKSPLQNSINLS